LYNAACFRALPAAAVRAANKSAERAKQASAEADRAMVWLTQAVAAGYDDAGHIEADHDLDALRDRQNFNDLIRSLKTTLEGKN
jgi:hypothetical protein